MMLLDGRICLVAGGVRGIGREISLVLADAGAIVIPTTHAEAGAAAGVPTWPLDVRSESSVRTVSARLQQHHGRLDVLVYNTGISGPTKKLEDVTADEWQETMDVNITGLYRLCHACIPLLRASSHGGRIICIASMTGRRPFLQRVPYAASKMAMTGFVRSLALELGPDGITVNTISPGYVEGDRIETAMKNQAAAHDVEPEEMRNRFLNQSPLHHLVSPRSIAHSVLFLAGDAARDITGADINVTAGVWMD
jgi:NAD(P)-dependent dehydrogenase (short-subunit alcohol dehydrogenase family)